MKKAICMILCLCVLATLFTGCGSSDSQTSSSPANVSNQSSSEADTSSVADDTVYEINLSLNFSEVSASGMLKWIDEVTEASGGRLKFNIYYSYSLVAMSDLVKGLQTGIVDMAAMVPYEYPSLFTLNGNLFGLPFLGWTSEASACEIYWDMVEECPELLEEYEEYKLHYLSAYMMPGYNIFMTGTNEMETPADLKGQKVITVAPSVQKLLSDNSGAPITSGPSDYYSNLEKGVADSIFSHINVLGAFGVCPELINKAVFFGDEYSGAYMYLTSFVFSNDFWNKLPADLQEILTESGPNLGKYMLESDTALTEKLLAGLEEKGAEIVVLDDAQVAVWSDALSSYTTDDLAEWSQENSATQTIYDTILDKIAASK